MRNLARSKAGRGALFPFYNLALVERFSRRRPDVVRHCRGAVQLTGRDTVLPGVFKEVARLNWACGGAVCACGPHLGHLGRIPRRANYFSHSSSILLPSSDCRPLGLLAD